MVYGETGQPYLEDLITNRVLNFWAKLKYDETPRLSKHVLRLISFKNDMAAPSIPNPCNFAFPWLEFVKKALNETGLGYAFDSGVVIDPKYLSYQVKRKLRDARVQAWRAEIESKDVCLL